MRTVQLRVVVAVTCVFCVLPPGPATAAQTDNPEDARKILLHRLLGAKETYIENVLRIFRQYTARRTNIDRETVDSYLARLATRARANMIARAFQSDLNADGRISEKELEASIRPRHKRADAPLSAGGKRRVARAFEADTDGDGFLTIQEVMPDIVRSAEQHARSVAADLLSLYALDPNKDGVLTGSELRVLAEQTFDEFDTDKSGWLDSSETKAAKKAREIRQMALKLRREFDPLAPRCELPAPGKRDKAILLSANNGHALSNISVAGLDGVTVTGRIIIEPGKEPIYLIVIGYANMIWQVDGAKERLAKLVVIPRKSYEGPGAGVVGVPADHVAFLEPVACYRYFRGTGTDATRITRAFVEQELDRQVWKILRIGRLAAMSIPSGRYPGPYRSSQGVTIAHPSGQRESVGPRGQAIPRLSLPPKGVDHATWDGLHDFYPSGVVQYEPNDVSAPAPVRAYDVLPQQGGLVQLMKSEAIRRWSGGFYLIQKPIARFPAGLHGAHQVKFVLGKGVPMPAGSPGHSCVVSEETAKLIHGTPGQCRLPRPE